MTANSHGRKSGGRPREGERKLGIKLRAPEMSLSEFGKRRADRLAAYLLLARLRLELCPRRNVLGNRVHRRDY
jgi:hypothetical protein